MSDEDDVAEELIELEEQSLIRDVWAVVRQLGRGAYGNVFHVVNIQDDTHAALKIESRNAKAHVLKIELEVLRCCDGQEGMLQRFTAGTTENFSYIIMTLCGLDLTRLQASHGTFSVSSYLKIAIRSLLALKMLHDVGFIHRDVKPCNFAVAVDGAHIVYVIDFGMTRPYACKDNKEWIIRKRRTTVGFRGTLRYCSVNMHARLEQGRADDLISWCYMSIEFRRPLPWRKMHHPEKVLASKQDTPDEELCGKEESMLVFVPIMAHLKKQTYPDRPDYLLIFETLYKELSSRGGSLADPMEWESKSGSSDSSAELTEKILAIHNKYGKPKLEREKSKAKDRNAKQELEYVKSEFAKIVVPGGEQYECKRKTMFPVSPAWAASESKKEHDDRNESENRKQAHESGSKKTIESSRRKEKKKQK